MSEHTGGIGPMVDEPRRYLRPVSTDQAVQDVMRTIESVRDRALSLPPLPTATEAEVRAAAELAWLNTAKAAGVWRRFWGVSFEAAAHRTQALHYAEAFVKAGGVESGRCLILGGRTGIGKTVAAICMLRARRQVVGAEAFVYFPDLAQMLLGLQSDEGMARGKRGGLVVLDDFGTEYVKKGGALEAKVDALLAYRAGNMLPTVITTNLTPELLAEHVSDRIVDRFREWADFYEVAGPSLRAVDV